MRPSTGIIMADKTTARSFPRSSSMPEDHARLTAIASSALDRVPEVARRCFPNSTARESPRPASCPKTGADGSTVAFDGHTVCEGVRLVYRGGPTSKPGKFLLTPIGAALMAFPSDSRSTGSTGRQGTPYDDPQRDAAGGLSVPPAQCSSGRDSSRPFQSASRQNVCAAEALQFKG